jgi:hypothetical protein
MVIVLPDGQCMNRSWYEWVVEKKFPVWIKASFHVQKRGVFLVQDHERCLWTEEPRSAMKVAGVVCLTNYPKCFQDLNPIETAWREVRARLAVTQPTVVERRGAFIVRLRASIAWVNRNRADFLYRICNSQVEWACDVLKLKGSRTGH